MKGEVLPPCPPASAFVRQEASPKHTPGDRVGVLSSRVATNQLKLIAKPHSDSSKIWCLYGYVTLLLLTMLLQ